MTVAQAIDEIQRVGVVEVSEGNLRLRFPESMRATIQPAIDSLRTGKAEALARLAEMDSVELARASGVLNRAGIRIICLEGGATIGVWSDLDVPEVRVALCTLGLDRLPFCYLDGSGVPMRCKLRCVEGEPVPISVLVEMERQPSEPWRVRDRMLSEMGWCSKGTPWAEWKAVELNRPYDREGVAGTPGRITAATVRHGEGKADREQFTMEPRGKRKTVVPRSDR